MSDSYPIPTLRFRNGIFYFYPSDDIDNTKARNAGFKFNQGWCTADPRIAKRLIIYADYFAKTEILGFLNPYDPYRKDRKPNDMIP